MVTLEEALLTFNNQKLSTIHYPLSTINYESPSSIY
jgi:hypothetical protein